MEQSGDGEPSVRLHIVEQSMSASVKLADNYSSAFFEPQRETNDPPKSVDGDPDLSGLCRDSGDVGAPEKKLTLFALRLAILEKAASGLGTLGFIWATVVLLGGFAIALGKKDFWFITIILLIEGARIFSRSHELEWQHQATWSLTEAGRLSFRALKSSSRLLFRSLKLIFRPFSIHTTRIPSSVEMASDPTSKDPPPRTWHTSDVPLLPFSGWVFLTRNVSRVLYWLQLLAASACVSLSLMRLVDQDFGQLRPDDPDKKNRKAALDIFYSLALAEALLFLAEKAYWEWKVSYRLLLEEVNRECHFGDAGMVSIKRFFYDAYSKCVEGSIFDGLKMDLVTFAEELLGSSSRDEQLIGARILLKFSTSHRFADATLRKIGTSTPVIERLIEMLNWKNPAEEEIRRSAAVIVSKLAGKKQNALRVAGISGVMESISSLLYTGQSNSNSGPDEASHLCGAAAAAADHANYGFSVFNLLGLLILKKLAKDHDNCGKIGNTRGLLAKIIGFTSDGETLGRRESATESQVKAVKRSLQVVKMLASTTGQTGKLLRQEISEIVFTVSNIRGILQYGENHTVIQKLGIEILTSLAMDEEARERIGVTGGMIKELLRIFFMQQQNAVKVEAGEALAMLALDSKANCCRILKEMNVVGRLAEALHDPVLRINASRILRNLCKHAGHEYLFCLRGVTAAIGTVVKAITTAEVKLLEVSLGLAAQVLRFMDAEEFAMQMEQLGIREEEFAETLVRVLQRYHYPSVKVPRMRRFVIEIAMWMMNCDTKCIRVFSDLGMEKELESVSETTSELECFNVFSGSVGLSRHGTPLCSLVDAALELMATSSAAITCNFGEKNLMGILELRLFPCFTLVLTVLFYVPFSHGYTYEQDVYAINYLYVALGLPPLPEWTSLGGDPCNDGWQGVECVNSNITAIILNGANLGGELGDQLANFTSLITMDLSNNQIGGSIPEGLPITIRKFFLSDNQLKGSIPGSLSELTLLSDMSLNNNLLSGELPDAFQTLTGLINLDLSYNNLTGKLPPSMESLSSLTTLHIQNNQLSGTLDVLQDLPLQDLNVENNMFSGPIPTNLFNIPNFKKDGNPFNTSIAPSPLPTPPTTLPFFQAPAPVIMPANSSEGPTQNDGLSLDNNKISIVKVVGYVGAGVIMLIILVLVVILCISKWQQNKRNNEEDHKQQDIRRHGRPEEPQISTDFNRLHRGGEVLGEPTKRQDCSFNIQGTRAPLMPPLVEKNTVKPIVTDERNPTVILNPPTSLASFSVSSLQQFTNSFSEENLIRDGRFGQVYLAEFPQGKLFAVLKLDNKNSNLPVDEFLKLIKSISEIRHPNIVELVGYCMDFGQQLLIYNYFSNTSLYDILHNDCDLKRKLPWNARIQIALEAAKALGYLHEGCQPPIVHQRFEPRNILINDDLAVQVSECGLNSLLPLDFVTQLSGRETSLFCYDAPEVSDSGYYSEKSDVHSFGIVMLELLTGRKPFDSSLPRAEQHLVRWASSQLHDIDALRRMMDPSIGQFPVRSLSRFADIISRCTQQEPEYRPPMSEVVQDLARVFETQV
ncbi:unnamed protein product [Musa hybrid cultivar]